MTRAQTVYSVLAKRFEVARERALRESGEADLPQGYDRAKGRAAGLAEAIEILQAYAVSNEGPTFARLLPRGDEEARERAAWVIVDAPR